MLSGFRKEPAASGRTAYVREPAQEKRPANQFLHENIERAEADALKHSDRANRWEQVASGAKQFSHAAKWTGTAPLPGRFGDVWKASSRLATALGQAVSQLAQHAAKSEQQAAAERKADAQVIRDIERHVRDALDRSPRERREQTREFERMERLSRTC